MEKQNEDYVTYDVAQLLQQKGYNERTRKSYVTEDIPSFSLKEGYLVMGNYSIDGESKCIPAPTLAEAAKWLRNSCGISVEPYACAYGWMFEICKTDGTNIMNSSELRNYGITNDGDAYNSYEIALSEGIKETLNEL